LVEKVRACSIDAVQLALDPICDRHWDEAGTAELLRSAGIRVISGMMGTVGEDYSTLESIARTGGIRPDATWQENLSRSRSIAKVADRFGLKLVTFHAGFLPHDRGNPERSKMLARLREIADIFGGSGVHVAFETGQESAHTLLDVMHELNHPNTGVNFDPANMILYGMGEPVSALRDLAPLVRQIHIKDATPTSTPGTWGSEVPAGTGSVNWGAFFDVVRSSVPDVNMAIEREAGDARVADIQSARSLVHRILSAR
jgi:hypothetical protein